MPGGVCAVLDYETEMMAEYISEMAMRVVMPSASVTPAFRKFVSQILTSTRLPSTTILLGMNYLAKRINMLNAANALKAPQEGQVWRMLTVALLLGSKFLDDNTFQNRSWSEVSGIPVSELNTLENEWLQHIGWGLYINMDQSRDYNAWLSSWKDWQDSKKREKQRKLSEYYPPKRLAPIVTNTRQDQFRHHPLVYEGFTPEEINEQHIIARTTGTSDKMMSTYYPGDGTWHNQYQGGWSQPQAPLTPPDSGYGTPEYLNSAAATNARYNEWFNHALVSGNYSGGYQQPTGHTYSRRNSQYQSSYYYNNGWDNGNKLGGSFYRGPYGQSVA